MLRVLGALRLSSRVAALAAPRPPLLAASWAPRQPTLIATALAAAPPLLAARSMGILSSGAVKRWVAEKAIEEPMQWRPFKWKGRWQSPLQSRRVQAMKAKQAVRDGEIKIEPIVMIPPHKFKGHKHEHNRQARLDLVAQRMKEMPQMIAEYRAARREKRLKQRAENRFK